MPLDPAILKARWGITDAAKDALVKSVADQAQALCETYCGRRFDLDDDVEDFAAVQYSFQVHRWPIASITALSHVPPSQIGGAAPTVRPIAQYRVNAAAGVVEPGEAAGWWAGLVRCEYRGGFEPWPPDLAWAVTLAADLIWAGTPGGGAEVGSTGASQAIKRISVVGVYSAELAGGDAGGSDGDNTWGILPPNVTAVLDKYRHGAVIGIG